MSHPLSLQLPHIRRVKSLPHRLRPSQETRLDNDPTNEAHSPPRDDQINSHKIIDNSDPEKNSPSISDQGKITSHDGNQNPGAVLSTKRQQLLWPMGAYVILFPTTGLLAYYLHEALVADEPRLGRLLLSPPKTLFLVSVFTQVFLKILEVLLDYSFDTLRWQLISRENGNDAPTFFSLSGATSFLGQWKLVWLRGKHQIWALQR